MMTDKFNQILESEGIDVFSINDATRIIKKPSHYTTIFLSRDRYLKRAVRGIYYTQNASEYEAASSILYPSYISLVSALRFHNLTEQIPNIIYVISNKKHTPINDLNGYKVQFIKIKKELMYGYSRIDGAFVAEPEKIVIDSFYLNRFIEYAEEAIESGTLNIPKLLRYAQHTKKQSVINRIKRIVDKSEYPISNKVIQ